MSRFEGAAIFDDWLVLDPPLINAQTRRWNGQLANPTMGRCLHEHWRDNFLYVDHSFDEYTSLPSPLVDAGLATPRATSSGHGTLLDENLNKFTSIN